MLLDLNDRTSRKTISLTPLIDVVFILLLFFMLSSTFIQWRQIDVQISGSNTATTSATASIRIDILADQAGLRAKGMEYSASAAGYKELVALYPEQPFIINAEDDVTTQQLINTLEGLSQAGATQVTLAEAAR